MFGDFMRICFLGNRREVEVLLQKGMDRIQAIAKQVVNPQTPGTNDSLTVVDNRTGTKYEIPITQDTIKASDLKKIKSPTGQILRSYDPGYTNTSLCVSKICFIDGDKGILRYRGYPIEQLANFSFEEISFLLLWGELPTTEALASFKKELSSKYALHHKIIEQIRSFPASAHPMAILSACLSSLGALYPEDNPCYAGQKIYKNQAKRNECIFRILAQLPIIAAHIHAHRYGKEFAFPDESLSFTANFLSLLEGANNGKKYRHHPVIVKAVEVLFVLHAEHELNCSTAACRHLASSGVDIYSCVAAGIGALYGPSHGGANEAVVRMLERIGKKENIPSFIEGVKNKKEKLMGFGHRVYKEYDPRAKLVRMIAEEVFKLVGIEPLIDVAMELERIALNDTYFIERKLYPNVDFYSGLIYKSLGLPTDYFPIMFAVPRVAGWLSHINEFLDDKEYKIVRPFQIYEGHNLRSVPRKDEGVRLGMENIKVNKTPQEHRFSLGSNQ